MIAFQTTPAPKKRTSVLSMWRNIISIVCLLLTAVLPVQAEYTTDNFDTYNDLFHGEEDFSVLANRIELGDDETQLVGRWWLRAKGLKRYGEMSPDDQRKFARFLEALLDSDSNLTGGKGTQKAGEIVRWFAVNRDLFDDASGFAGVIREFEQKNIKKWMFDTNWLEHDADDLGNWLFDMASLSNPPAFETAQLDSLIKIFYDNVEAVEDEDAIEKVAKLLHKLCTHDQSLVKQILHHARINRRSLVIIQNSIEAFFSDDDEVAIDLLRLFSEASELEVPIPPVGEAPTGEFIQNEDFETFHQEFINQRTSTIAWNIVRARKGWEPQLVGRWWLRLGVAGRESLSGRMQTVLLQMLNIRGGPEIVADVFAWFVSGSVSGSESESESYFNLIKEQLSLRGVTPESIFEKDLFGYAPTDIGNWLFEYANLSSSSPFRTQNLDSLLKLFDLGTDAEKTEKTVRILHSLCAHDQGQGLAEDILKHALSKGRNITAIRDAIGNYFPEENNVSKRLFEAFSNALAGC